MGKTVIVVQKNDHSLGYYDLETGAERGRVALDPFPHEFAVSADGRHAFCCHFGVALAEDQGPGGKTVSIVDVPGQRRVGTIDCREWRRPHDAALDGAGRLYVLSEGAGRLLILDDPLSGAIARHLPTGGEGAHWVTVTRDGRLAFASNMVSNTVSVLCPQDPDEPPRQLPTGIRPEGSVLNADETRLYVVNRESSQITVIDVERLSLRDPIATPPGPVRICRDAAGQLLVALYHDKALARIDPARPEARSVIALPERPVSVGYDADLDWAFASTLGDEVCAIDLKSRKVARRIATRSGPDPVAILDLP